MKAVSPRGSPARQRRRRRPVANDLRRVLEVGVDEDDRIATRCSKPAVAASCWPKFWDRARTRTRESARWSPRNRSRDEQPADQAPQEKEQVGQQVAHEENTPGGLKIQPLLNQQQRQLGGDPV